LHFDFGSFQCFSEERRNVWEYVKSTFWTLILPLNFFNNPTTKSLRYGKRQPCVLIRLISIYCCNGSALLCDRIWFWGYLTLNFVQAFAMNSGAPIYPILQPVMAKALATHLRWLFFLHSWIDAMLQKFLRNWCARRFRQQQHIRVGISPTL
jgi:hypothetical protein